MQEGDACALRPRRRALARSPIQATHPPSPAPPTALRGLVRGPAHELAVGRDLDPAGARPFPRDVGSPPGLVGVVEPRRQAAAECTALEPLERARVVLE